MRKTESTNKEYVLARYHNLRSDLMDATESIAGFISENDADHLLLQDLGAIRRQLKDDKFTIGLFGVTAAGKSTLINALMGDSILREGLGETTRTMTRICASEDNHPDGQVSLLYKTRETLDTELKHHLSLVGFGLEEGSAHDLADPSFRAELQANIRGDVNGDLEIAASCKYLAYLLDGWDHCKDKLGKSVDMSFEDSDHMVHQEHIASYIDERVIYHDCALTRDNFVFIDAPGVGSSCARHTDEAVRLARDVSAAILVTKVDYQFMPPDRRFLRDAMDAQRMQERNNLVFVLNQIKEINPMQSDPPKRPDQFDECVDEQVDRLRARLAEAGIEHAKIHPLDAACGNSTRKYKENPDDPETVYNYTAYAFPHCLNDPDRNLKASRLDDFEQALKAHLTGIRYYGFLSTNLDRLKDVNDSYNGEVNSIIKGYGKDIAKFKEEMKLHEKNKVKVHRNLKEYLDIVVPHEIDNKYDSMKKEVDLLVEETVEAYAKNYVNYYMKKVTPTAARYQKEVTQKTNDQIYPMLKVLRDSFEKMYIEMKRYALDERVPEIFEQYKIEEIALKQINIKTKLTSSLKPLETVKINLWHRIKSALQRMVGIPKEAALQKMLMNKYHEIFGDSFTKNITQWIKGDWQKFSDQVNNQFCGLMDQIESKINKQIDLAKKAENEREECKQQLERFAAQSKQAMTELVDLEQEIEKVRPHSDLPN